MTPPNGYYIALVQYDTGGALLTYVHVHDGVIRANDGNELYAEACSEFSPVSTQQFCAVWPDRAAKELDAARMRIKQLEDALRKFLEAGVGFTFNSVTQAKAATMARNLLKP